MLKDYKTQNHKNVKSPKFINRIKKIKKPQVQET